MLDAVTVFCHSSICLRGSKTIYIDPYAMEEAPHDADLILCTHTHYDHYSPEDIEKVKKETTIMVAPENIEGFIKVEPGETYEISGVSIQTTYAYNEKKPFHPKENRWVGYQILLDGVCYYVAGDTDAVPEIRHLSCDVAFLPIGGTYTMDVEEAAQLCETLQAKAVVPVHYGKIVGTKEDAKRFASLVTKMPVVIKIS